MASRTARTAAHVDPSHQPLRIDMGVEELAAERLERANGLDGDERRRLLPAADDDLAAETVHGADQPSGADASAKPAACNYQIGDRPP